LKSDDIRGSQAVTGVGSIGEKVASFNREHKRDAGETQRWKSPERSTILAGLSITSVHIGEREREWRWLKRKVPATKDGAGSSRGGEELSQRVHNAAVKHKLNRR